MNKCDPNWHGGKYVAGPFMVTELNKDGVPTGYTRATCSNHLQRTVETFLRDGVCNLRIIKHRTLV